MKLRVRADAQKAHVVGGEKFGPGEELPGDYEDIPAGMAWKLEAVGGNEQATTQVDPAFANTISAAPVPDVKEGELMTEAKEQRRFTQGEGKPQAGQDAYSTTGQAGKAQAGTYEDSDRPGWYQDLGNRLGNEPTRDDLVNYADGKGLDVRGLRKDEMVARINEAGG